MIGTVIEVPCRWCDAEPATTIVYGWPTGERCRQSTANRVAGYQGRLERAAKGKDSDNGY